LFGANRTNRVCDARPIPVLCNKIVHMIVPVPVAEDTPREFGHCPSFKARENV
jgi:hypothetical protein